MKNKIDNRKPSIPKIIHQLWNTENIPDEFKGYRESWLRNHPHWQYHLWTSKGQRDFLEQHYPWILPLYDAYPVPIKRVDIVRYFILWHFGGLYIDLDMECLCPIDPFLIGKTLVLGEEPVEHLVTNGMDLLYLDFLLCNAIMASIPNHPFWPMVVREAVLRRFASLVIHSTGPLMLTYAYKKYPQKNQISLEYSESIYPINHRESLEGIEISRTTLVENGSYAIHHWAGTWNQKEINIPEAAPYSILDFCHKHNPEVPEVIVPEKQTQGNGFPIVSCLLVFTGEVEAAKRAIHFFRLQTWPSKELVIIDADKNNYVFQWIEAQEIDHIKYRYVTLPSEEQTLGNLLNIAINYSTGEYIAQWNDDISSPSRLVTQMEAIQKSSATVCLLNRHRFWFPERETIIDSAKRLWKRSMVCKKSKFPPFPKSYTKKDTPPIMNIVAKSRAVVLDSPNLYTHFVLEEHGSDLKDFDKHLESAHKIYTKDTNYQFVSQKIEQECYLSIIDLDPDRLVQNFKTGSQNANKDLPA